MSKPGAITAPPSANVSDMLAILADPDQYRKHLTELKALHKDIENRLGLYNDLEKIQAYHKDVKAEAVAASKAKAEAEALWSKVKQASENVVSRTAELDEYKLELDETQADNAKLLAEEQAKLHAAWADHEKAVETLTLAQAKLRADQARHDARVAQFKEWTDAVRKVIESK